MIDSPVLVSVLSVSWLAELSLRRRLLRTKSLEQLVTGEVARMHAVHVSHLDALTNGFPADEPSDEGLDSDYGLNVALEHLLHPLHTHSDS